MPYCGGIRDLPPNGDSTSTRPYPAARSASGAAGRLAGTPAPHPRYAVTAEAPACARTPSMCSRTVSSSPVISQQNSDTARLLSNFSG
jgi:hypothetical protein